jgi:HD-GYP domain-containing protein (c-di-GMP phosphodiesterase class II)
MPGKMDGLKTLEKMRSHSNLKRTPVIMLTVQSDIKSITAAKNNNAEDYIVKPIKMGMLLDRVERLINKKVENLWKDLEPFLQDVLVYTLDSFVKTLKWAEDKQGEMPLLGIQQTCVKIIQAIDKGKTKPLLQAVEDHESELFVHAFRTALIMVLFSKNLKRKDLNFSEQDVLAIPMGGLLHDRGMVDIKFILLKTEKLTEKNWSDLKKHVNFTIKRLRTVPGITNTVIDIAGGHHERGNGSGYPSKLKGREISTEAQMAGIVDTYEALVSKRRYREKLTPDEALNEMKSWDKSFDISLFESFIETVSESLL